MTASLRVLGFALLAFVAFHCARVAFWDAFTSFHTWDDEGYFLLALREFRANGGLYESIRGVFYGPLYFQTIVALSWITRLPIDSESARWLLLLGWFVAYASTGYAAWRLTRSFLAPALVIGLAFPFVDFFTNEPLHATSVVLLFVAPLVLLIVGPLGDSALGERKVPRATVLAACGALCAALFLVKANLGVYFALGMCATLASHVRGGLGAVVRIATALALVVLPLGLMRPLLGIDWVFDFALLVAISLVPFAVTLFRPVDRNLDWRGAAAACAGFVVVLVLSIGASFISGTTASGLWRSLVEEAIEFPLKNHYSPGLPTRAMILVTATAIPLALALRKNATALAVARLAASGFLFQEGLRMQVPFASLPFVWIAASGGREGRARYALGVCAVLSSLQAYPIPGCQVGLFSLLAMLVGVVGLFDAVREIPQIQRLPRYVPIAALAAFVAGTAHYLITYNPVWNNVQTYRERWQYGIPLGMSGTGPMRRFELDSARLRWVAENLRENADTFVGAPGMHSFHAWTQLPPPVPFYKHHWVLFRDEAEEEALARSLTTTRRACVIRNDDLIGFWLHAGLPDGPVKRVIDERFTCVGVAGDYRFLIPLGQEHRLVLNARPLVGVDDVSARYDAGRVFEVSFPALGEARITRLALVNAKTGIELFDTVRPSKQRRLIVTDVDGNQLLTDPGACLPGTERASRVLMVWPKIGRELDASVLLVRVYDSQGRIVARCLVQRGSAE